MYKFLGIVAVASAEAEQAVGVFLRVRLRLTLRNTPERTLTLIETGPEIGGRSPHRIVAHDGVGDAVLVEVPSIRIAGWVAVDPSA